MVAPKKKKLNYFDYDKIVSIVFGSTKTVYNVYDLKQEEWERFSFELTACLYQYDLFESYDDYEFISFGSLAKFKAQLTKGNGVFYIDKLSDKVEYLFSVEPNIKEPLKQAKDRLYQKAVVQYFQHLIKKLVDDNQIIPSKSRYLMTYPSHWTLEQAAYFRSLLQEACIVDEQDHPDRLIMYNEGDVTVRHIQSPLSGFPNIREGQKYMICDLSGSKVEMHLYDIKGPVDPKSEIKSASRCNWYNRSIKEPAQMYITEEDFYPETTLYLSSILSTPSIIITAKELENTLSNGGGIITDRWIYNRIECLTEDGVERNTSISYNIPQSLHKLFYEKLNNVKESTTEPLPQWIKDRHINLYSREIKEKVLKPVRERIIQYIKKIVETVSDTVDDIILVSSKDHTYLMKLIANEYKKIMKRKMYKLDTNDIVSGALLKYLDNITKFDIYKPKIVHNDLNLHAEHARANSQDVIVLVDYGLEKTRVSYFLTQSGQISHNLNIKHIMDWPSQSTLNCDFPTLNAMLIPNYPLNIGKDSMGRKRDLFINFLSGNSKAMLVSQENGDYDQTIASLANTLFYTFEKDEYGIILVTHKRKKIRKVVAELLIATTTTNSTTSYYKITRKRISFLEFSLLYFEYLADFLHNYIYSKTGTEKDKHRYCITYDNQGYPEKFTLSNKDIRQIALESNLISANFPNNLLVLGRAEAVAIYCRKLIDTTIANKEAHLYFLQVQLHPDRCLLILNTVPRLDREDSNSYREDGKPWDCVHKYAKTENIPIKFMDIISENLWVHMQNIGSLSLRKCEQHQSQKRFFNSKNMQIVKNMFYDYFSTTKNLNLEDGEKEHTIHICDKDSDSCCYLVTTSNLLELAFNPAIDQLVSIVQSSIFNQNLFKGLQISDIFVMGKFLNCQDYVSYKFLEELLLAKLRNIHFPHFDNLILEGMNKKTQVRKLNGQDYQQGHDGSIEDINDSLVQVSSIGSIIFSIDPKNLLVERVAFRTYVVQLDHISSTKIVYNHQGKTFDGGCSIHIIILKGTPLNSLSLVEDTISKHFMITERNLVDYFFLDINLLVVENDNVSYLTDTKMDEKSWRSKFRESNFEKLKFFHFDNPKFENLSYPFSFKFCLSQTKTYKVWTERGKNSKEEIEYIREPILLKSCHNE